MVVYVEYAFAENFLIDGALLYLTLRAVKIKANMKRVLFSALLGGIFALIYPLLRLPDFLSALLKLSVGGLLCIVALPKSVNIRSALPFTLLWFFALSFAFAGGLFALYAVGEEYGQSYLFQRIPATVVLLCLFVFTAFSIRVISKIHQKRRVQKWIYECVLHSSINEIAVSAFLDSGNLANRAGLPVCFLTPDLIYELFERKHTGQVCDEITISTISGQKTLPLYKGNIEVFTKEKTLCKEVYFAPSIHMISKEYSVLLPAEVLEE